MRLAKETASGGLRCTFCRTSGSSAKRAAANAITPVAEMHQAAQLLGVAVEAFEFGEEYGIVEIAVNNASGVVRVQHRYEAVSCFFDGSKVPRGNVSGRSCKCKIF